MAKLSVIIPTYNSSLTISNCIKSLLDQTFVDFEIIVMDGLSVDDTLSIVGSYKDDRIKIFSEKDSGVYDAMNKAIRNASGEWLYFLGSDDFLYASNVFEQVIEQISNAPCDLIYGNAFFLKESIVYDGKFDRVKLFQKTNICHQSIFYKKELFSRLGNYNLEFPLYADWDFNIRCFSTPDIKIEYIDLTIVCYNDFSGISNSGAYDSKFYQISGYELVNRIDLLEKSTEYRIGKMVLYPFRIIKRIIHKWFQ